MNTLKKYILMVIWMIFSTLSLTYAWGHSPDFIPRMPDGFAIWLSDLYGAKNQDEVGDLDMLCMLAISFGVAVIGTALALIIWRRFCKNKNTIKD